MIVTGALAVLAAGCSSGSPTASTAAPTTGSPTITSTSTPTSTPTSAAQTPTISAATTPAPQVQQLHLTVSGNSVTGDTGTVAVKLGHPVELTVTSDVADEIHVHGADVDKDVDAGGTVVLNFTQNAPGRFEIELEHRKRTLTRLQVS